MPSTSGTSDAGKEVSERFLTCKYILMFSTGQTFEEAPSGITGIRARGATQRPKSLHKAAHQTPPRCPGGAVEGTPGFQQRVGFTGRQQDRGGWRRPCRDPGVAPEPHPGAGRRSP
jgi:hypothetical protein